MRYALVFACLAVAMACSGAKEQDVFSKSSSSTSTGGTTSASSSSGTTSGSSSGGTTTSSSGGVDSGVACQQEVEPNDSPERANRLMTSVCGAISSGSDVDYVTFTLPSGTKTMDLTFEGDIRMKISVEGHNTVEASSTSSPNIPFEVGKPYLVEVRTNSSVPMTWRVNVNRT